MIVCVCHRISDREIARHARAGMGFEEIQFELGVATHADSVKVALATLWRNAVQVAQLPISS